MRRALCGVLVLAVLLPSCSRREGEADVPSPPSPPPKRPDTLDLRRLMVQAGTRLGANSAEISWRVLGARMAISSLDDWPPPSALVEQGRRMVAELPESCPLPTAAEALPSLLAFYEAAGDRAALEAARRIASSSLEGMTLASQSRPVQTQVLAAVIGMRGQIGEGDVSTARVLAERLLAAWREGGAATPWGMVAEPGLAGSAEASSALALLALSCGDWDWVERNVRNHVVQTLAEADDEGTAAAILALSRILRASVEPADDCLTVHLLLNTSTPEVEVNCFLPYKGHIDIYVAHGGSLRLRCHPWVDTANVWVTVNRIALLTCGVIDGYWTLEGLKPGDRVAWTFTPRSEVQVVATPMGPFTAQWKGDALLALTPPVGGFYADISFEGNPAFYDR